MKYISKYIVWYFNFEMNLFGWLVLKSDLTKLKKNLKTLKSKIKKPKEMESDFLHKAQVHLLVTDCNYCMLSVSNILI